MRRSTAAVVGQAVLLALLDWAAPAGAGDPHADPGELAARATPRVAAVIIDPGHGGADPGASRTVSAKGRRQNLLEKDLVLEIAENLATMLRERFPEKRIVMIRSDDRYLSPQERAAVANAVPLGDNEAAILLSIHANAAPDPLARGPEVWYLPRSYHRAVIDRESSGAPHEELYEIINGMRAEEYAMESALLGRRVLAALEAEIGSSTRGLKPRAFQVMRSALMPAVLVEVGFLSNPQEAALLASTAYLKKLSRGIYNGASDFITFFDDYRGFMECQ